MRKKQKDTERQRQHFESISQRYYTARQAANHLLLKKLMWSYFFKRHPELRKPNIAVLEPMCGYAEGKKIIETNIGSEISYTGFDYSRVLVNKVKKENPNIHISWGDVTTFKAKEKYDLIILVGGLHHVYASAGKVVQMLSQALRPGGHCINFEPTQNNPILKMVRRSIYRKNNFFDNQTERAFDFDEINSLYTSNGFKIIDQIFPGLMSYTLYYNPDAFPGLNIGGETLVKALFYFDKIFFDLPVGKIFSFATLTLLQKQ